MKKLTLLFPIVVAAMIGCNNTTNNETANTPKADSTPVAEAPKETPPPAMDSATQMKVWQEYMTPGDMHKMLASSAGTWATEQTIWMDENKPPEKVTGTCENKMIMGGRYLQSMHKGMMMGMPFEGLGITGYDNHTKMFTTTWQDNMSTGMMYLSGTYDAATKTMTLKGSSDDPMYGKMEVRQEYKFVDDKHQEMAMYGTPTGGKERKWMEMKLTKK